MIRVLSVVVLAVLAAPATAQSSKEADCGYQADVVAAVQAARVARVREGAVADYVTENTQGLPEKYAAVVPLVTPWVYGLSAQELRDNDLGADWKALCLSQ